MSPEIHDFLDEVSQQLDSLLPYHVQRDDVGECIRVYDGEATIMCRLETDGKYLIISSDINNPHFFEPVMRYELCNPNDFDIVRIAAYIKELGWRTH